MSEKQQQNTKKPKQPNKWVILTGAGIQMGVIIFGCAYIGKKLDIYFKTSTAWFTLGLILIGIFASMYLLLKQVKKIDT
ncbi:AtpZ/AtpI family protein [Mesohalobacter halotolerans]|uniref:AtpZ/AtpI family protein n=1 Tax=Mesohalobacter halotolerans TaxID=1883405 RepID=A0A4U5TSG4_9FLAO|nr:AtpZ/AtpI family protein [Mesohalobacter halotolerans]MBS3738368.1 AtpZ/AtpI family protein [Psychroflexus sp.]TKS57239.1 AtpZ/AtpI family protein [Mesohalobacter halotolerans]